VAGAAVVAALSALPLLFEASELLGEHPTISSVSVRPETTLEMTAPSIGKNLGVILMTLLAASVSCKGNITESANRSILRLRRWAFSSIAFEEQELSSRFAPA
jgi:hypothetical protein